LEILEGSSVLRFIAITMDMYKMLNKNELSKKIVFRKTCQLDDDMH